MKIITALNDYLLVKPRKPEEHAGIIIPASVDQEAPTIGEVVIGNHVKAHAEDKDAGVVIPGQIVLFRAFAPKQVEHNGEDCLLISASDVYAVIEE